MKNIGLMIFLVFSFGCKETKKEMTEMKRQLAEMEVEIPKSTDLKYGSLWKGAQWIDNWYAVDKIDDHTYILMEPKSSQYNSSYLIIGDKSAILLDVGSGERPKNSKSIKEIAQLYTQLPVLPVVSHFHFDHTGDVEKFPEGFGMIDLPQIKKKVGTDSLYKTAITEHGKLHWKKKDLSPVIKVKQWLPNNDYLDLGNRKIKFINLGGHTPETTILIDEARNYIFTGDFLYKDLGGIVAFAPGVKLQEYADSASRLVSLSNQNTQFFGAHGEARFDYAWAKTLDRCFSKILNDEYPYQISYSFLTPGVPLRAYIEGKMVVFGDPLTNPVKKK